jgi:hypothetical protein
MRLGDLLELLGAACLVASAYLWVGLPQALIVAGVALVWVAQGFGATPLPRTKLPRRKAKPSEPPERGGLS